MNEKKKILLVEDDSLIVEIYTTRLKQADFEIESVPDGESAIRRLKEKAFDLVLLDIVLPNIDGWEILRKIKKDDELKKLEVIILSNLGQKEEVEKGMKLGASKYIIKAHHTPSEVAAEVKKILE